MADLKTRIQRLVDRSMAEPPPTQWRVRVEFIPPDSRETAPRIAEGFQPSEAAAMDFIELLGLEGDPYVSRIDVDEVLMC